MESNIVKDFQNLHVLNTYNFERMDELVQDLTNALEETTRASKAKGVDNTYARRCKKRRSRKRRPPGTGKDGGNLSEASESSIDEALKDYMESVFQHSDSDDLIAARRISSLPLANIGHALSLAESDSVTENFSPMRIHRRRRKCKRMAIDPQPDPDFMIPTLKPKFKRMRSKMKTLEARTDNVMDTESIAQCSSHCPKEEQEHTDECSAVEMSKKSVNNTQESSSSLSSSESDGGVAGIYTNDEGRDGDDEQSDFFHEAGPACGIPGIIPWWESDKNDEETHSNCDQNFQKILSGSFDFMSNSSKRNFKTRVSKLLARREIRAARRRLKSKRVGYPMPRLQHNGKEATNGDDAMFNCWATSPSTQSDVKRRRKTPPSTPTKEGYVGQNAEPIPEDNKGQQMLRTMGWIPGTGLGRAESGITNPVLAYVRPKRKGLICEADHNS